MGKRIIMKNIRFLFTGIIMSIIFIPGCVNSLSSPTSVIDLGNGGAITITAPVTNDSVSYTGMIIDYKVKPKNTTQSVELYIDGNYNSTYFTTLSASQPLTLSFEKSKIGTRFSYYLKYYDTDGSFAISDTMKNILIIQSNVKLYKPYDLKINVISNFAVNISWKDSSSEITAYEVERKAGATGTWVNLFGSLPAKTFNVNDNTINLGVNNYSYRVRGKNNFSYSDYSDEINTSGTSGGGSSGSLAQPVLTSAIQTNLPTDPPEVTLTWFLNDPNANYFNIERRTNTSSDVDYIKTFLPKSVFVYKDKSVLTPGNTYKYDIKAYSNTDSSWSNTISVVIK